MNTINTLNTLNTIKEQNYIIINNHTYKFIKYIFNKNKNIILFDLDNTLIKFNLNSENYELMYNNIITKLQELILLNNIIIISNQKQLNKKNMYEKFMKKINKFFCKFSESEIYSELYISIKNDKYRKPNTSFINIIKEKYFGKILYYCGDALGRKNDFNDTDLKFALNLSINIKSPEEVFLNKLTEHKIIKYPTLNKIYYNFDYIPKLRECVILVGYPASGKSSIANLIFEKGLCNNIYYKIINRDNLKTIKKCIIDTENSIKNNMSIIIDNTNPSKESRKIFIDIAKKYNYYIKVIIVNTSYLESYHRNYYRHIKYNSEIIPLIAYNVFKNKYKKPTLDENIDYIIISGTNIYDINYFKYFF
jgi:bifunctional polynucleotide phosphatase/kinase